MSGLGTLTGNAIKGTSKVLKGTKKVLGDAYDTFEPSTWRENRNQAAQDRGMRRAVIDNIKEPEQKGKYLGFIENGLAENKQLQADLEQEKADSLRKALLYGAGGVGLGAGTVGLGSYLGSRNNNNQ
jgi:hypothetical protein